MFKSNDFSEVIREKIESRKDIIAKIEEKKVNSRSVMRNPLMIYETINIHFSLKNILMDIGCDDLEATNCYCPFHGEIRGLSKPSAKYFEDSDTLYCYQEQKSYTAYHGAKELLKWDISSKFVEAWNCIDEEQRSYLLEKYGAGEVIEDSSSKVLKPYSNIFEDFKSKNVSLKQYRVALRNIIYEIYGKERQKTLCSL
ncbi:MAG: hypothetical protein ACRC0R_03600 [Cetobacterium sp.]